MAINANFPSLSFADANPYLTGLELGRKSMRDSLNYPKELLARELENRKAEIMNKIYGVQAQYEEPLTKEKLLKSILENKYYGPNMESQIGLRGAETNKMNQMLPLELQQKALDNRRAQSEFDNPLLQSTETKKIAALKAAGLISPEQEKEMASNIVKGSGFGSGLRALPADFKSAYLAKLQGMGYNPQEAAQALMEDRDLGDMAQAKGFERDLSNVPSVYSPTASSRTLAQRSNMATAGLDVADEKINQGIAHYAGQPTIKNVPLGFYKDAIAGINQDKQSDFIASSVLAQDQAFLRARQAGAPLSQGLLKHTLETSLTDKSASFPFVSPEVFKMAGKKIKQTFDDINRAENQAISGQAPNKAKKETLEDLDKESPAAKQKTQGKNDLITDQDIEFTAKKYNISKQEVIERLKKAGRM